jgi:hypothetical protein
MTDVNDMWLRLGSDLIGRVSGPMKFRLYMQPAMAAVLATLSRLRDVKAHLPPFFWAIGTVAGERMDQGWLEKHRRGLYCRGRAGRRYQLIQLHFVYPGEALIVAFILAIVPYVLLRGLVNRLISVKVFARRQQDRSGGS